MNRRSIRNAMKRGLHQMFRTGQRFGVDILPRHFYSSVPDIGHLSQSKYWRGPMEMVGVSGAALEDQLAFARQCCTPELSGRLASLKLYEHGTRENGEPGYGPVETDFLYCFIQSKRPARIVQVGAGFSTAIILKAAADCGYAVKIIAIDPFPTDYLKRLASAGQIELISEMAQTVDRNRLTELESGEMLFVDSTHTVKAGSEVNRLILDVLPRLASGVYVHFHDIYFPYDYQRNLLVEPLFWGESTLLHAFLIWNSKCTLRCSLSMLHYGATAALREMVPTYQPQGNSDGLMPDDGGGHFPNACYLQMV